MKGRNSLQVEKSSVRERPSKAKKTFSKVPPINAWRSDVAAGVGGGAGGAGSEEAGAVGDDEGDADKEEAPWTLSRSAAKSRFARNLGMVTFRGHGDSPKRVVQ